MDFPRTMTDTLVEMLRVAIIRGEFAPGDRLRLAELSDRFDVSAMPIRGALAQLENDGLVTTHPHRGATVTKLSAEEVHEIYEMRVHLEPLAIRAAVPKITTEELDRIEKLAVHDSEPDDVFDSVQKNNLFHMALYAPSERLHLLGVIVSLRNRVSHYIPLIANDAVSILRVNDDHQGLLEACRTGDVEEAARITAEHLMAASQPIGAAAAASGLSADEEENGSSR